MKITLAVLYPVHTCALMLVVLSTHSLAVNFVESPSNITQPVGSVAEFRCQHQSIDAVIGWLVNGSLSSQFPDVTQINSGSVSTLTILSVPEYNETEVVCEAILRVNGSHEFEQTPLAILTVITVDAATTTEEPVATKFTTSDTVPSPPVLIVTMEERHVYMCNHSETINVFWRVNGSVLRVEIFPVDIDPVTLVLPGGDRVYTLTIGGRLEHNSTTIQCSARLSGGSEVTTPSVLFLMQGQLQSVKNLERRNDVILWDAPFSLNLTNVEPDIVYCVDVYNITCGGRELLISDCDVMETRYTSDVLQSGYIYEYTVTPRSNVEGAQNGTSKTVTEQFMDLQLLTRGHSFSFVSNNESGDDIEGLKTRIHLDKDPEQIYIIDATSYSLSLVPLDGFEEDSLLMSTYYVVRNGISIMLTASLPYRRIWNYTVLAQGCEEHPLLETNELSTHDVQNISVTSPQPGEVRVTGDFIDGSTATGLLTIVISTSEIFYHLIERRSDQLHIEDFIQGVVGGEHSISFFVVEESGLPFERAASTPKVVSVENGNDINQPSIEYSLQSTSTGVCITCTFLEDTMTECFVVVHKHTNSHSLMSIEANFTRNFSRSGDTASGCIEGVNMEDYQVGVIGGKNATSETTTPTTSTSSTSSVYIIVGIVLGVFLGVLSSGIVVTVIIIKRQKKRALQLILPPESPLSKQTNTYGTVLPLGTGATGVHEGTRLIRVESDGSTARQSDDSAHAHDATPTSASPPPYSPPEREGDSTSPPPVPPPRTKEDSNVVGYAETVVSTSATVPPPTEADRVVYQEVGGTLNAQGQHYTLISDLPTRTSVIPDDPHRTVYSVINPQEPSSCQVTIAEKNGSEKQSSLTREDTSSTPFTLEHILPEVMPMASKWQALGEALSLDEDRLDEIFTNNENDEACLHDMLELYMERSNHSWEEIESAMRKVREKDEVMDTSTNDSSPLIPPRDITGQMLYHSNLSQHNNDVSDTAPVSDDRSCLAPGYCSEESLPPLQGAAQLMIFSSSVQQGTCTKERENDTITDERFCPDMYSHEYVLPIQETSQPLRCSLVHGRLPMLGRLGLLMMKLLKMHNCGKFT